MMSYLETLNGLRAVGVPLEKAEAEARRRCKDAPDPAPVVCDGLSEKQIEQAGDRAMQKCGFEVIRFSHPGKTQQTPGISDRRYYRRPRSPQNGGPWTSSNMTREATVLWVEYKSADGEQRPGQKVFQELVTACGETYLLAGPGVIDAWLVEHGFAQLVHGALEPIPQDGLPF